MNLSLFWDNSYFSIIQAGKFSLNTFIKNCLSMFLGIAHVDILSGLCKSLADVNTWMMIYAHERILPGSCGSYDAIG